VEPAPPGEDLHDPRSAIWRPGRARSDDLQQIGPLALYTFEAYRAAGRSAHDSSPPTPRLFEGSPTSSMSEPKPEPKSEAEPRRSFLTSVGAIVVGAIASIVPIAAGATALLDPLRRGRRDASMTLVTKLSAIPESGAPQKFTVQSDRVDAWTTYADTPVGAIYLRRTPQGVSALNVVCPHAGCFVGIAPGGEGFACPCHKSSFGLDGSVDDPASPSPRAMDSLDVEVRNGDEVWVRFQNFLPGREEKTPV
jgi:Rieske Fe-S protein